MLALMFLAGWVRGHRIRDILQLGKGHGPVINDLVSSHHGLMWRRSERFDGGGWEWNPGWISDPIDGNTPLYCEDHWIVPDITWRWTWCGFDLRDATDELKYRDRHWVIPYWCIVLPLTMLSTYLLLTKPPKSTPTQIFEPIPNESGATS